MSTVTKVLFYTSLAVYLCAIIASLIVRVKNKEIFSRLAKNIIVFLTIYTVAVAIIGLSFEISAIVKDGYFDSTLFFPILGLFVLSVILVVMGGVISKLNKPFLKKYSIASFLLISLYIIILVAIKLKGVYSGEFILGKEIALIASTLVLTALLIVLPLLLGKKTSSEDNTKSIVYASICIALSFSLSYIRIFRMPQDGSITLASLLPLMIYSYMFGIRKGVVAGFVYGILQAMQDPFILHPLQFLLDYPIAFSMIGFIGIFKEIKLFSKYSVLQFMLGAVFGAVLRYICHLITGIIVFDIYAPESFNAVTWSLLYNLFVFVDMAIAMVAGGFMLATNSARKVILKT